MEQARHKFEDWRRVQVAREERRAGEVLDRANATLEFRLAGRWSSRTSFYGNEDIEGFSYSLPIPTVLKVFNPKLIGLFQEIWSASTNPLLTPKDLVCHIARSQRALEIIGESVQTQYETIRAITFVFDGSEYGLLRVGWNDTKVDALLHPGSIWRPEPLNTGEIAALSDSIAKSPETSSRLALMVARESTKSSVLKVVHPIEV